MTTRFDIPVAVIGAGVMGSFHARNYLALPGARLVAVVDPDPSARRRAEAAFGRPAYPNIATLLRHERVQAASLVAPTTLHYELGRELLDAGIHTLIEKPVTVEVRHALELAERSRARDLVLQVGHITRFFRAVDLLVDQVHEPYLIEARRLTPHSRITDVGVILDLMIHDIDIVLRLVDAPIDHMTVDGQIVRDGITNEDVAAAQIRFANGCIARFLASRVAPDRERSLVVAQKDRTYRVDFLHDPHTEVAVYRSKPSANGDVRVRTDRHVVADENPLRAELAHFLDRIANGAAPIGTLEDDLRSLRVATELVTRIQERAPEPGALAAKMRGSPRVQ